MQGVIKVLLQKKSITFFLFLFLALGAVQAESVSADDSGSGAAAELKRLIVNGGYAVKKNNRYIATRNLHTSYVPASIIKIATALAALDILGPEFRFKTEFYRDARNNLYIKGWGDPFLISEEVAVIVGRLKGRGCSGIHDIYLDSTAFRLTAMTDGAGASANPYDALNIALAVNFNTIHIDKSVTGTVVSAEEQTPTLPVMARLAENLEPGNHRININQEKSPGIDNSSRYAGELFRAFLKRENITGAGKISLRQIPENLEPFYTHYSSKTLAEMIGPLMLYSNNFIANQLFLVLGAHESGFPATWEKSTQAMADYLQQKHKLSQNEIKIIEGSGLSRKNRVSPHAMIRLLDSFRPYAEFLPRENSRLLKSGTLQGVYTFGGYFMENQSLDSFVLLLNQGQNNRDRVLAELEKIYRAH